MSVPLQSAWLDGYLQGIRAYSWSKDGVAYVGDGVTTLKQAIEEARRDFKVVPDPPSAGKKSPDLF